MAGERVDNAGTERSMRRRGRIGSEIGAAFLEGTVIVGVVMFVLMTAGDLAHLAYRGVSLQYAVTAAGRWSSFGLALDDPNNPGSTLTREASIVRKIQDEAETFGLALENNATFRICPVGVVCGGLNAGGPNSTIEIEVTQPVGLLFDTVTFDVEASVLVKNEPFT